MKLAVGDRYRVGFVNHFSRCCSHACATTRIKPQKEEENSSTFQNEKCYVMRELLFSLSRMVVCREDNFFHKK